MHLRRRTLSTLFALACSVAGCSGGDHDPWVVNAAIASAGPDRVFVAGYRALESGFVKQLNSGALTTVHETSGPLGGIWVDDSGTVVAVGSMGNVAILSDNVWRSTSVETTVALRGVWGSSPNNVLAVGHGGAVRRYNGVEWHDEPVPTKSDLHAVWGSSSDDIFAVGNGGLILRYDGSTWSPMPSGTSEDLNSIWGRDAKNVYAVGGSEITRRYVVLKYDGTHWSTERMGTPYALLGVHGNTTGHVYAVGASRVGDRVTSAMLHFDGSEWYESTPSVGQFLWDALALEDGGCYAVGPDDTLVRLR
jgi:hypothetical protein